MNRKQKKQQITQEDEIENFYLKPEVQKHCVDYINPNPDFVIRHPFMGLCIGATGSMKSNCLMNLLKKMNGTFEYLILVTQDKKEPLYLALEEQINDKEVLTIIEGLEAFNDYIKDYSQLKEGQTLVIFDDMCVESESAHSKVNNLYIRGRKMLNMKGISCLYLSQSYYQVPKILREQSSILILKKINGKYDIDAILRDCGQLDCDKRQLNAMYKHCVTSKKDPNFMLINKGADDSEIYRKNFNTVLNPDDF